MKITQDHWLEPVHRELIAGGSPMTIRRFLVVHHTAGASGQSSIDYWRTLTSGVCAHLVIERDGSVIQCRPFNRTCGHAGRSTWHDGDSQYTNLNSCSIGIELANAGDDKGALSWARKQPGFRSVTMRHKNGGPLTEWECYPSAQLAACEMVSKLLVERYNLDDLIGHEDIAPSRKTDPGPAFPMANLRLACNFEATIG